jgi:hypothetical protein
MAGEQGSRKQIQTFYGTFNDSLAMKVRGFMSYADFAQHTHLDVYSNASIRFEVILFGLLTSLTTILRQVSLLLAIVFFIPRLFGNVDAIVSCTCGVGAGCTAHVSDACGSVSVEQ